MPKIKVSINKTNQGKINKWIKNLSLENKEQFSESFNNFLLEEMKTLRECSEKSIVEAYIEAANNVIKNSLKETNVWVDSAFDIVNTQARSKLAHKYTSNQHFDNNIDVYFNEVKREYILHPMNESDNLEFLPENRDIFIKNNLKLVINCAKRYRGLGLTFEDLIQAGNEGLLIAFDKFDTKRANLRKAILDAINESELEIFTFDDAKSIVESKFTYGKNLDKTISCIPKSGFEDKKKFKDWVMVNVKTAVFASVAFQWIKALILYELSNFSTIIKIPKQDKHDEIFDDIGMPAVTPQTSIINLDSINPHTDDCYTDNQIAGVANEEFIVEAENIEREENETTYKYISDKILNMLNETERRIVKKRFGIGFPSSLSINEIAESENIPVSKVKHTLNQSLKELAKNLSAKDKETLYNLFIS